MDRQHDPHDHDHDDTQEFDAPAHQHEHETVVHRTEPAQERVQEREVVYQSNWSPAQIVALVGGVFFIVLGGIAMARAGLGDFTTHTQVGGFHHTTLLGLLELILGIFMLAMGAIPGVDRTGMIFTGSLLFAFGLVVGIQGESFHGLLGTHSNNGWLYVIIGGILLIVAVVSPVIFQSDKRTYDRRLR